MTIHRTRYETDVVFRARQRLKAIKKRCISEQIAFDLDESWLVAKMLGKCELTGLTFDMAVKRKWSGPYTPSVDRIRAGAGYTKDNCRVILFALNVAFGDWSMERFLPIAEALVSATRKEGAA